MRVALVVPPLMSPTHPPLGVATLAAHLEAIPSVDGLVVHDWNLRLWRALARGDDGAEAAWMFFRGQGGEFFSESTYLAHTALYARLQRDVAARVASWHRAFADGPASPPDDPLLLDMAAEILADGPSLVGLSVTYQSQLIPALVLVEVIRAEERRGTKKRCLVVIGGAAMSSLVVDDVLGASPGVDCVALGEGERTLEALASGASMATVPGLVVRRGASVVRTGRTEAISLTHLPAPAFHRLPLDEYLVPRPVLPVAFSRGCRWSRCRFCVHNASFLGFRRKAVERFVDDLVTLQAYTGARHFYLVDEYVVGRDLLALAAVIEERGLDLVAQVMGRPSSEMSTQVFRAMADAGLWWVSWGVESLAQPLLDLASKGTRAPVIEEVLAVSADAGISNLAMMIHGLPGSTDETMETSFAGLERIYHHLDAMTASAFALFANSRFGRSPEKYGLVPTGHMSLGTFRGMSLRSLRLSFLERAVDGTTRPPRGPLEVAAWRSRRRWLGEVPFLEGLPAEHYLLYVDFFRGSSARPSSPRSPSRPYAA